MSLRLKFIYSPLWRIVVASRRAGRQACMQRIVLSPLKRNKTTIIICFAVGVVAHQVGRPSLAYAALLMVGCDDDTRISLWRPPLHFGLWILLALLLLLRPKWRLIKPKNTICKEGTDHQCIQLMPGMAHLLELHFWAASIDRSILLPSFLPSLLTINIPFIPSCGTFSMQFQQIVRADRDHCIMINSQSAGRDMQDRTGN